jgi:valyl-tRNA synthetase
MTTDLPKTYDPAAVEATAYQTWLDEKAFHAEPSEPGDPYCIVIPPPNVTGALHLGHAINNTLQDILTRMHRMAGFNTLWIPGIDHAGIATQAVVEKQLKEQENKTRHDVGREGLIERIWTWKQQYGDRIVNQLKRLGCSCDWDRQRFTLDEQCARAVRHTFFKLFKDGLIYRGKRLVNWDIFLQTSISDDEIYHETVKTNLWHIAYPIEEETQARRHEGTEARNEIHAGGGASGDAPGSGRATRMIVATTRPETMLGDTAVAVHSEDPRWNWAIGKFVRLPLTNRLIPIIADDILVDPKFGSGVVKVTPAHDPNDYAVWQRHQGKDDQIEILNILTPDGKINENGGAYAGMKRDAARKKVVEDLAHQGLLVKEEPYETQVGHSDRSKTPVEPYLSDQWFVKMAPLAEPALQVVRDGTIKFYPERHAQQYLAWLGEKRDWPISRQLWWGHRIPVWRRSQRLETPLPPVEIATVMTKLNQWRDQGKLAYQLLSDVEGITALEAADPNLALLYICLLEDPTDPEMLAFFDKYGLVQDPDVLDTWFSSALWPHSTLGWPDKTAALDKWYPTSVLLTGRDIITLWVARMVMTGMYNMGWRSDEGTQNKPRAEAASDAPGFVPRATGTEESGASAAPSASGLNSDPSSLRRSVASSLGIPFHDVAINPTILDGKGERMSKSKGNGVDPVDVIETHGADALRFTLATMATETQDVRMPVKKDAQGRNTSDKFDLGRNFCTKLWNAARFTISNIESIPPEPADEAKWSMVDRWIVSRFNRTVEEANAAIKAYRFDVYAKACYDFFWRDFCDWYVEATKPAMKDPARAGQTATVLAALLDGSLRLMHPIIPFITETIWWRLCEVRPERGLPGRIMGCMSPRLIKAAWPTAGSFSEAAEHVFPKLQEVVVAIRNVRNDYKVDPKKPVTVSIQCPGEDATMRVMESREMIELLATCKFATIAPKVTPPPNSVRVPAAAAEVFVEGLVDAEAEKQRDTKRRDELTKLIATLNGRLNNAGYVAKAPPQLVDQTKKQLADAEAELKKLGGG